MIYRFLDFSFNTRTSELTQGEETVVLNNKPFSLLKLLVENPHQILNKDFLIDMVWQGRIVSDNTISQTVAQLRQALGDDGKAPRIIKTYRGRGISFIPAVSVVEPEEEDAEDDITPQPRSNGWVWTFAGLAAVLLAAVILWPDSPPSSTGFSPTQLMIIPQAEASSATEQWLQQTTAEMITESMDLSPQTHIRPLSEKPGGQDLETYIETQWKLSPQLQLVETLIQQTPAGYELTLFHTDAMQQQKSRVFAAPQLQQTFRQANEWLQQQLELDSSQNALIDMIPDDAHILELYMRGLAASQSDDYTQAENYYQLALQQHPDFYQARIKLAQARFQLGNTSDALLLLDSLETVQLPAVTSLEAVSLRADILDVQGEMESARDLLDSSLLKYANMPQHRLNPLRFALSYTYAQMNQLEQALAVLDQLETHISLEDDPSLFLGTMHKKASLFQYLGRTREAHEYVDRALDLAQRMGRMGDVAKLNGLKGRLYSMESDYAKSKHHLFEALKINRQLGDKLNVGAGMNDLIYILIRQGSFDQAEAMTREMQDIAIEIEYARMLMAAKQHQVALAIARRNWNQAEQYLQLYEDLATSSNHQSALTTGYLLRLEYLIEKGSTEGTDELLNKLDSILQDTTRLRQRIALDIRKAQLQLIKNQTEEGIARLISTREMALQTQDGEAIIEINQLLARQYLSTEPEKALQLLEEAESYNPLPYPHLLLKSKTLLALGKPADSLMLAQNCKVQAGDWWQREDEVYLNRISASVEG